MRVELTNGNHAELRGAETVRRREITDARRATDGVVGTEAKDVLLWDIVIASLLESWTLDLPLPRVIRKRGAAEIIDGKSLEELTPAEYKALFEAADEIHRQAREGIDSGPDGVDDPQSPTGPSSD